MYKRLIEIIVDLSYKNEWHIDQISEKYHVSPQTIRNDINSINELLDEYHHEKIKINKGKIICPENFTDVKYYVNEKLKNLKLYDYHLSKNELVVITTLILIFESKYITINRISDNIYIGRTTLINNLASIYQYADSLGLTMSSSSNKGILIKNTELEKRAALVKILKQAVKENEFLLNLILKLNIITEHDYRKEIRSIIQDISNEFQISFSDSSFNVLNYYLNFMIERLKKMDYVDDLSVEKSDSYQYAYKIIFYISNYFNIPFVTSEVNFLDYILDQSIHYSSSSQNVQQVIPVQLLANNLIDKVSDQLHFDLNQDFQLYENLSNHLISIYKNSIADEVNNPVLDDIRNNQADIIQAVKGNILPIQNYFHRELSDIEIIYISVHFSAAIERYRHNNFVYDVIIACNAGAGISQLIKSKLSYFNNVRVIRTIDAQGIHKLSREDADLIISTIPLYQSPIEYVNISSRLANADIIRITNKIKEMYTAKITPIRSRRGISDVDKIMDVIQPLIYTYIDKDKELAFEKIKQAIYSVAMKKDLQVSIHTDETYLYQMLTPEFIQLDVSCENWKDAIYKSSDVLLTKGFFNQDYVHEIVDITEKYGPYYLIAPNVAIPHAAPGNNSFKLGMSLIRLSHSIEFGNGEQREPISYLIILSVIDKSSHLRALFSLTRLFLNQQFVERLDHAKSSDEVADLIYSYETQFTEH